MIYSDAEPGLTSNKTQAWLKRQKNVAHNITLRHAPLAERMIGYIKEPDHPCHSRHEQEVVGSSRRRGEGLQREPRQPQHADDAKGRGEKENQTEVKEQLESIRKTDNPQPRIAEGDKVRVVINKKFEKGYMPDWSDEVYTVQNVSKGPNEAPLTHISYQPIIDRQAMYQLRDPNNTLNNYKNGMFTRSELLLVQKAR